MVMGPPRTTKVKKQADLKSMWGKQRSKTSANAVPTADRDGHGYSSDDDLMIIERPPSSTATGKHFRCMCCEIERVTRVWYLA
jgi:hypothetical protein